MDESEKHYAETKKPDTNVGTERFRFHDAQEQAQSIPVVAIRRAVACRGGGDVRRPEGALGGGDVLCLACGTRFRDIHIYQNSSNGTFKICASNYM